MKRILLTCLSLCFLSINIFAQSRSVTGTVTSKDDGLGIPGASIRIKGTSTGTLTDPSGKYTLNASVGSTLIFSFVGYASQEVRFTDQPSIDVILTTDTKALTEVVVTGLGVRRQARSLGYSVSTVKGDDLVKSGEVNVIEGLAAKATGVQITSSSGTPGASSKIILRGPATFMGDNQPLIVVDGVPVDNSVNYPSAGDSPYNNTLSGAQVSNRAIDLNPEDIESVTILKGPAAAAIYGQSAGNGAVLYTTKRGRARKGLGVNFSSTLDLATVSRLPKLQSRYGQGAGGVASQKTGSSFGPDLTATNTPTFDNVHNFFKTGATYNNNLSVTGGNDVTTFRVSTGATNQTGIIPHSYLNRYNFRLTADSKLNKVFTVGGTMNYTNSNGSFPSNGSDLSGVMLALLRMPVDFDGRNYVKPDGTQNTYYAPYDNPFYSTAFNPYTEETNRLVGNAYADAKLSNIFTLSLKAGTDSYNTQATKIYSVSSNGDDNSSGLGQVNRTNVNYRNFYTDLLLKFNTSFGEKKDFTLTGLAGGNFKYSQYLTSFERGRNLSIPGFYNFSNASELYVSDNDSYQNSKALLIDATLGYKNILFLTATGRNEWSSTFGKNGKGFFYPKADLSYVFSSLLSDKQAISYGKIRVAYANVGISPPVYADKTYYGVPIIADGFTNGLSFPYTGPDGNGHTGYSIGTITVADNLKPERNEGLEAGLEMKFLNDRIGLDATVYQQTSHDLLIAQPVAPTSGFQQYFHNVGEIRNRGIEIGLSGDIIKSSDFTWNMAVNFSKNKNTVLKLAPGVDELTLGNFFVTPKSYAIVGQPFGVLYGNKFQRDAKGNLLIDPTTGLPMYEATQSSLGDPNPKWLMNVNNTFTYKALSLSFLWDFRKGGTIWDGTWQSLNFRGKSLESQDRTQTYVIPGVFASGASQGQPNTFAVPGVTYVSSYLGAGGSTNELAFQSGSWVRLRSVNLAYRFNLAKSNPRSAIQFIELGAGLRNILLFTKYKGVDPETSLTGAGQNAAGYDYFNNPGTKSVSFSLRAGF